MTTTTIDADLVRLWDAAYVLGVARSEEAAATRQPRRASHERQAPASSLSSVADCVKGAESGNYAEASHPGSGSGAYQYIPGTWRTWSARAGYPGYAYAYLAPPAVQDAVFEYTIANGGAHNWDPKFGADSCTVGLP